MAQSTINIGNQKGQKGGIYITDTSAHTGLECDTIIAHEAAVANITAPAMDGDLSAVVLPVGVPFFAPNITAITLASGKVMAYYKV